MVGLGGHLVELVPWSWGRGGRETKELGRSGKVWEAAFLIPFVFFLLLHTPPHSLPHLFPCGEEREREKTPHRLHPQVREPRLNLSERSIIYVGCKVRDGCTGRGGGPQEGVFVRRVNGALTGRVGRQASGCWSSNWVSTACPVLFFFF